MNNLKKKKITFRLRIILFSEHNINKLLYESVHVRATPHRVLDKVDRGGDTERRTWVDARTVLVREVSVYLHSFVEAGFGPVENNRWR